jgi:hypothetical protein
LGWWFPFFVWFADEWREKDTAYDRDTGEDDKSHGSYTGNVAHCVSDIGFFVF